MYGCESWNNNKETGNHLTASEMWLLHKMLRISYVIVTNEKVARTTRSLVNEMRKRQALFIRHVMRKEIEYFVANREKLPGNEEGVDRKRRCLTVTHHGHTKKKQHK